MPCGPAQPPEHPVPSCPPRRNLIIAGLCAALIVGSLASAAWAFGDGSAPTAATTGAVSGPSASRPGVVGAAAVAAAAAAAAPNSPPATGHNRPLPPGKSRPSVGTTGVLGTRSLTGSDAVALTFDDGPDPTYTPQILDVLAANGVRATFCVIGSRARDYPDLIRRIAAGGHSFCNHSWQHLLNLGARDRSYQEWDLRSTNEAIRAAVPDAQIRYFRAPGGNYTQGLIDMATIFGLTSMYWDVDPRDWDAATHGRGDAMVGHIVSTIQDKVRPGSIVLSHDRARPDTISAYQILLPWLRQQGYDLVPLT